MAFGRPPYCDSSIDGIGTPQASRLTKRLNLYFSGEEASEPDRVTLVFFLVLLFLQSGLPTTSSKLLKFFRTSPQSLLCSELGEWDTATGWNTTHTAGPAENPRMLQPLHSV